MEETLDFVIVLIITFSILQIILFFKVWGMTNDVRKIKGCIKMEDDDKIRKAFLKGDKKEIEVIILDELIDELIKFTHSSSRFSTINEIKDYYKKIYIKIDVEFPENIDRVKGSEDIIGIVPQLNSESDFSLK